MWTLWLIVVLIENCTETFWLITVQKHTFYVPIILALVSATHSLQINRIRSMSVTETNRKKKKKKSEYWLTVFLIDKCTGAGIAPLRRIFPVEGIFPLKLAWVWHHLPPPPPPPPQKSSFGWEYKLRSSRCIHVCIPSHGLQRSWHSCPRWVNASNKKTPSMHHPWRQNVTTSMVGLKNGHKCKNLAQNELCLYTFSVPATSAGAVLHVAFPCLPQWKTVR